MPEKQSKTGRPPLLVEQDQLLTPGEVAAILRLSVSWVREHTTRCAPKLPGVKLGGQWRYRASEIEKWLVGLGINRSDA